MNLSFRAILAEQSKDRTAHAVIRPYHVHVYFFFLVHQSLCSFDMISFAIVFFIITIVLFLKHIPYHRALFTTYACRRDFFHARPGRSKDEHASLGQARRPKRPRCHPDNHFTKRSTILSEARIERARRVSPGQAGGRLSFRWGGGGEAVEGKKKNNKALTPLFFFSVKSVHLMT